jgi:hypothetical protein
MRSLTLALILGTLCFLGLARADDDRPLLKRYRGQEHVPDALYQTYAKLVKAMRAGSEEDIRLYCLPHAFLIEPDPRPEKAQQYGRDMNLPFLKTRFRPEILAVRKDPYGCYVLNTATSYFFFLETKNAGWKVYRYGDTPIQ